MKLNRKQFDLLVLSFKMRYLQNIKNESFYEVNVLIPHLF